MSYSFVCIHSFKYLLLIYYMMGTVLSTGYAMVNEMGTALSSWTLQTSEGCRIKTNNHTQIYIVLSF